MCDSILDHEEEQSEQKESSVLEALKKGQKIDLSKAKGSRGGPTLHLQVFDDIYGRGQSTDFYAASDQASAWDNIGDWNDQIQSFITHVGNWIFYQDVDENHPPGSGPAGTGGYVITVPEGRVVTNTVDVGIPRQTISSLVACPAQRRGGWASSGTPKRENVDLRRNEWQKVILPALKKISQAQLVKLSYLARSTVILRAGRIARTGSGWPQLFESSG